MKRSIAMSLLGLITVAASPTQGQGTFYFGNYWEPDVPITYLVPDNVAPFYPSYTNGAPVGVDDGVQLEVWWALGSGSSQPPLEFGALVDWSAFDGYTDPTELFTIPDYQPGETVYLQLRTENDIFLSGSGPVIEVAQIADVNAFPPQVPPLIYTPGFSVIVPEPSVLGLAGLAAATLLIARRRHRAQ